eukprot:1138600-Pelagomonas_calceolata.AAC.6
MEGAVKNGEWMLMRALSNELRQNKQQSFKSADHAVTTDGQGHVHNVKPGKACRGRRLPGIAHAQRAQHAAAAAHSLPGAGCSALAGSGS